MAPHAHDAVCPEERPQHDPVASPSINGRDSGGLCLCPARPYPAPPMAAFTDFFYGEDTKDGQGDVEWILCPATPLGAAGVAVLVVVSYVGSVVLITVNRTLFHVCHFHFPFIVSFAHSASLSVFVLVFFLCRSVKPIVSLRPRLRPTSADMAAFLDYAAAASPPLRLWERLCNVEKVLDFFTPPQWPETSVWYTKRVPMTVIGVCVAISIGLGNVGLATLQPIAVDMVMTLLPTLVLIVASCMGMEEARFSLAVAVLSVSLAGALAAKAVLGNILMLVVHWHGTVAVCCAAFAGALGWLTIQRESKDFAASQLLLMTMPLATLFLTLPALCIDLPRLLRQWVVPELFGEAGVVPPARASLWYVVVLLVAGGVLGPVLTATNFVLVGRLSSLTLSVVSEGRHFIVMLVALVFYRHHFPSRFLVGLVNFTLACSLYRYVRNNNTHPLNVPHTKRHDQQKAPHTQGTSRENEQHRHKATSAGHDQAVAASGAGLFSCPSTRCVGEATEEEIYDESDESSKAAHRGRQGMDGWMDGWAVVDRQIGQHCSCL